ncbi:MAG: CRISPR-associated endonuclease Cas1 [Thermoleophilia bacterium]|nr:CRISPR-associated endonuclease Cas1 [Thermoleophilia bacterium]
MQLIINTYGAYLRRRGELFQVKVDDAVSEVSARKVRSILIATAASMSTDAVQLAIENNIDIIFLDKYGNPYGRVWHSKMGSTAQIRRKQLEAAEQQLGLNIALGWVRKKFDNQVDLLERMRKRRTRLSSELTDGITQLKRLRQQLEGLKGSLDERRNSILGIEGNVGRVYWNTVRLLLPEKYRFSGRSRNPAKDEFNCLLNYAYGVLYGTVERGCILAGLDPFIGFIHTDNYNKKSLVFDLIEVYRVWADESVISLFASRKVKQNMFDRLENGMTLNQEGKAVLMANFSDFLSQSIRHRGRNIKRRDSVQFDCHALANKLIKP